MNHHTTIWMFFYMIIIIIYLWGWKNKNYDQCQNNNNDQNDHNSIIHPFLFKNTIVIPSSTKTTTSFHNQIVVSAFTPSLTILSSLSTKLRQENKNHYNDKLIRNNNWNPSQLLYNNHLKMSTTSKVINEEEVDINHMGNDESYIDTNTNGDIATIQSSSSSSSIYKKKGSNNNRFDSYNYLKHWYPVVWVRDLPINRPTKITLFDIDYVIARTKTTSTNVGEDSISPSNNKKKNNVDNDYNLIAMIDSCPHKQAALSEGRITSNGQIQCSYHGWTFNGTSGQCTSIPQLLADSVSSSSSLLSDKRICGKTFPIMIHQNMIWLYPGGYDYIDNNQLSYRTIYPPTIPEINMPNAISQSVIRDFPIDYMILLENIMDPDHGLFAHHAPAFDLYSASNTIPMNIEESFLNNGTSWIITSRVQAIPKLISYHTKIMNQLKNKKQKEKKKEKSSSSNNNNNVKIATTTFYAPNVVVMARRDPMTNDTNFVSTFYICPVGTGKSRFMSCGTTIISNPILNKIIHIPRWIQHIFVNNFLDEDTYLLATQQNQLLQYELNNIIQYNSMNNNILKKDYINPVRRHQYIYRSPSEKLNAKIGQFWDITSLRIPQRTESLISFQQSTTPLSREIILDRSKQHLQICPESQEFVNKCTKIQYMCQWLSSILIGWKLYVHIFLSQHLIVMIKNVATKMIQMKPTTTTAAAATSAATNMIGTSYLFNNNSLYYNKILSFLISIVLNNKIFFSILLSCFIIQYIMKQLIKEFYFIYNQSYHNKKVNGISKVWFD